MVSLLILDPILVLSMTEKFLNIPWSALPGRFQLELLQEWPITVKWPQQQLKFQYKFVFSISSPLWRRWTWERCSRKEPSNIMAQTNRGRWSSRCRIWEKIRFVLFYFIVSAVQAVSRHQHKQSRDGNKFLGNSRLQVVQKMSFYEMRNIENFKIYPSETHFVHLVN